MRYARPLLRLACASTFVGLLAYAGAAQTPADFPGREWFLSGTTQYVELITLRADGDSCVDVISTSGDAQLGIFHGSPKGLVASGTLATSSPVSAVAAGDIDGDGYDDLVFVAAGGVWLSHSAPPTGFTAPVLLAGGLAASDVEVGDVDGDQLLDILCVSPSPAAVHVLRALTQGGFAAPITTSLGMGPVRIAVGDLDLDQALDVVLADTGQGMVLVAKGDGAGGFVTTQSLSTPPYSPTHVSLAPMNADGFMDVISASSYGGTVHLALGMGNGTFAAPTAHVGYMSAFAGDWTGDGKNDLIVTSSGVQIHVGNGAGGFGPTLYLPTAWTATAAALADIDGDGHADVVVAAASKLDPIGTGDAFSKVGWVRGDGTGRVAGVTLHSPTSRGGPVAWMEARDLDLDGDLDVLGIRNQPAQLVVRRGDGVGGFMADELMSTGFEVGRLAVADVNGDGWLDLIEASSNDAAIHLHRGSANGFLPASVTALSILVGRLAAGDLNGDGRAEVLVCGASPEVVHVFFPTAQGTLSPTPVVTDLDVGYTNYLVEVIDLDFDGRGDVVVGSHLLGVSTWLGDGTGQFLKHQDLITSPHATSAALGDLDEDGAADLLLTHSDAVFCMCNQNHVVVHLGDGAGGFGPGTSTFIGMNAVMPRLALVDDDSHLDVVATMWTGEIAVLSGDGQGGFGRSAHYAGATVIGVGDVDGDARAELVTHGVSFGPLYYASLAVLARL